MIVIGQELWNMWLCGKRKEKKRKLEDKRKEKEKEKEKRKGIENLSDGARI